MANWVIRCSERYLSPIYFRLHELLLKYDVIQQDETSVEVSKDGRPANSKSYMWVYRSGKYYTDRIIILYKYQKTRKAEHPQRFLEGFHGVLERIAGIYHMDNQLSELSEEERYRKRQLLVRPLVEALFAWLKKSGMKKWSQKEEKR